MTVPFTTKSIIAYLKQHGEKIGRASGSVHVYTRSHDGKILVSLFEPTPAFRERIQILLSPLPFEKVGCELQYGFLFVLSASAQETR